MKNLFIFLVVSVIYCKISFAQKTFNFSDSTFQVNTQMVLPQLFNPDCQIDINNFPIIDSLANFLLKNKKISIQIIFHTDTRGNLDANQLRTEICGKNRLQEMFYGRYQKIQSDRISYECKGESEPIFTQKQIDQLTSESKKEDAQKVNRRTVIKITKTNFGE